jgi:hypothetical protein
MNKTQQPSEEVFFFSLNPESLQGIIHVMKAKITRYTKKQENNLPQYRNGNYF